MKLYSAFEQLSEISVFEKSKAEDILKSILLNNQLSNELNNDLRYFLDQEQERRAFCDATQTIN